MRIYSIGLVLATAVSALVATNACSSYSPNLPAAPFLCGSGSGSACPEGYTCTPNGTSAPVCVAPNGVIPPDGAGSCANDSALEPNDTIATAYPPQVDTTRASITYGGLAICPAGDKDTYAIIISNQSGENLDVQVIYEPNGATLQVGILSAGGSQIQSSSPVSGMDNTVHAAVQNIPQGEFYAQVSAVMGQAMLTNNYKLAITTN